MKPLSPTRSIGTWLACGSLLALAWSCSRSQPAQASETAPPAVPATLAVRAETGFVGIVGTQDGQGPWTLPLQTRSERRVCAAAWMDEVEWLTTGLPASAELRVQAVAHPVDTEVVQDERGLWQLGEPLPWGHDLGIDPLPWMRRDGEGQSVETLTLPAVLEGQAWVLFPLESEWGAPQQLEIQTDKGTMQRPAGGDSVWLVEPQEPFTIELGALELDALVLCEVERIPDQKVQTWEVEAVAADEARLPSAFAWQPFRGHGPLRPTFGDRGDSQESAAWHGQAQLWRVRLATLPDDHTWTLQVSSSQPWEPTAAGQPIEAAASPAPWMLDVTNAAGLRFLHQEGPDLQMDIRPTMGPGAAIGDFDGDGWPDVYLVQGGGREGWPAQPNRLFRNRRDGRFEDVTASAGVGDTGAGMGALFFDVDGDRDLDLYVANYGADTLYQNQGDGTFRDVSVSAGLRDDAELASRWSASVCAGDYDGDGDLDLYVTSYLDYDLEKMPPADELERFQREDPVEMLPFAFPGQANVLWRNDSQDGEVRFTDVAPALEVHNPTGLSMQALWWDFDQDLDLDLYVANDVSPNVLYLNRGDGTFEDVTFVAGLDDPRGGMGLDLGDVDQDGDEDLFLSNWQLESNALYLNQHSRHSANRSRRANFRDATVAAGLGPSGVGVTSWGVTFFDCELDGDLDLLVVNGYTSPDYAQTGICVGQPNQLFLGQGRGRFVEASYASVGPALRSERASRCALPWDFDRDGDLDLLITANNGWLQLLRNDAPRGQGHSLSLRLRNLQGNAHGIGSRVTVRAGERTWTQALRAGIGYLGGNAPELLFGLGPAEAPVEVEVVWPDGHTTQSKLPSLDTTYELISDGSLQLVPR